MTELEKYEKAGSIAKKVKKYSRKIIEKDLPLIELAEKIEERIIKLGGKIAFPTNLSKNNIAAHYSPLPDDKTKAGGLLKVDIGIHINGYIADTAFSLDLENNEENKKLIKASEKALKQAIKKARQGIEIWKIGNKIEKTISSFKFTSIKNLQGHKLGKYNLHAGTNIPNYNNKNKNKLSKGFYAIEPFATTGYGRVYEGKPSGVYRLIEKKQVRSGRDILNFIIEKYSSLPFCSRWLVNKFGKKSILSLKQFEKQGILHQYPQLLEKQGKVSQTEHTVLIDKKCKVLT